MEITKGMYVRTNVTDNCNNVYIVKICEVDEDEPNKFWIDGFIYDSWGDDVSYLTPEDIKKASYNIIDLIEEGDYVNEHKVYRIHKHSTQNHLILSIELGYDDGFGGEYDDALVEEEIESVVTKEQFEGVEYRI